MRAARAGCTVVEHGALATAEAFALLAERGVWFDPNIGLVTQNYLENKSRFLGVGNYTEEGFAAMEKALGLKSAMFGMALKTKGLKLVMGTDAVAGAHGRNVNETLERIKEGQRPMDAIVAMTSAAAQSMGLEATTGAIAPGLEADLVAVDGDPLADPTAFDARAVRDEGWEGVSAVTASSNDLPHRPSRIARHLQVAAARHGLAGARARDGDRAFPVRDAGGQLRELLRVHRGPHPDTQLSAGHLDVPLDGIGRAALARRPRPPRRQRERVRPQDHRPPAGGDQRAARLPSGTAVAVAQLEHHQVGAIVQLHREPVPALLMRFQDRRAELVVHPAETRHRHRLAANATNDERAPRRHAGQRVVVRGVAGLIALPAQSRVAVQHRRTAFVQRQLEAEVAVAGAEDVRSTPQSRVAGPCLSSEARSPRAEPATGRSTRGTTIGGGPGPSDPRAIQLLARDVAAAIDVGDGEVRHEQVAHRPPRRIGGRRVDARRGRT